jgi:hypothetical protein
MGRGGVPPPSVPRVGWPDTFMQFPEILPQPVYGITLGSGPWHPRACRPPCSCSCPCGAPCPCSCTCGLSCSALYRPLITPVWPVMFIPGIMPVPVSPIMLVPVPPIMLGHWWPVVEGRGAGLPRGRQPPPLRRRGRARLPPWRPLARGRLLAVIFRPRAPIGPVSFSYRGIIVNSSCDLPVLPGYLQSCSWV